jgi:cell wall-associated NlpC family hydrolase
MRNTFSTPTRGIPGMTPARLEPQFWLDRLGQPDRIIMDPPAIAAYNAGVIRLDPHVHDLRRLAVTLPRDTLMAWITASSQPSRRTLHDEHGHPIARSRLRGFIDALALDALPASVRVRHGLIVRRASLRSFPTPQRVFRSRGNTDLDRFQECALVPGTPLAILHESRDGEWHYVESPLYRGWVQKAHIALGDTGSVLDYQDRTPFLVVTDASVSTVFSPEAPAVSNLRLEMGTRIPVDPRWPGDRPVNGQGPSAAHVAELPSRRADGRLQFARALLPRSAGVGTAYLPLTRGNLLRQAFKFLGERYDWGGAHGGRDCSGFVSDVYRSMGIVMPRNAGAQAGSPAADRVAFGKTDTLAVRLQAIRGLEAGDLVYTPDHVMMIVGHLHGQAYVIHDAIDARCRDAHGSLRRITLNGVAVTPLLPLWFNSRQRLVERMTAIVRFRPPGS